MRTKILIGIGLFFCSLLLSAWLVLRSEWLRETLRVWAVGKLEDTIRAEVEVERVRGSLLFDLVLEGVRITPDGEDRPILQFEKGEMGYNPLTLLTENKEIRYVEVWFPTINLSKQGEKWNFQALFPPKDEKEGNPQGGGDPLTVKHVAIVGGNLNLEGVPYFDGVRTVNLLGSLTCGGGEVRIEMKGGRGELPGGVEARKVAGRIRIRGGEVHLEGLRLLTRGSSLSLDGTIADSLVLKLLESQLSLQELDNYLSLGGVVEGEAKGSVLLSRRGGDLHVSGRIAIPQGRFGEYQVEEVGCSVLFEDRNLRLDVDRGKVGGGEFRGKVLFDFKRGKFRAEGEGARIDVTRFPLNLPRRLRSNIQGSFRIESRDLPWRKPPFEGKIRLRESILGGVPIDSLNAVFRASPGVLQLDSLEVKTGGGAVSLTGSVSAQRTNVSIMFSGLDLSQLGPPLGVSNLKGRLSSDLLLQGDLSQPSLFGTFWVREAEAGGMKFEWLSGNLDLEQIGRRPLGRADVHFVKGEILHRSWESGDLSLNADGESFSYLFLAAGEDIRLDLGGTGVPSGDSLMVEVDRFLFRLNGDRIANRGPIDLVVKGGELQIRKAHLNWPGGSIAIAGLFSPSGKSELMISGDGLSLRETSLLSGLKRDIRGVVQFSLNFEGELADPRMVLTLEGRNLGYQTGSFDTLDLQISYEGRTLQIDKAKIWREGATSEVTGSLPMDLSLTERGKLLPDGRISVTAILNNVGVWVFSPFKQFVEVPSGKVNANLDVGGTWMGPTLSGEFALNSAKMLVRFLGTRLSSVNCHLLLKEERLIIDRFSGATDNGQVRVSGLLELDRLRPTLMDITVKATGVQVTRIENVSALVDADIRVRGTPSEPLFQGQVKVEEALITMPFRKRQVGPAGLRSRFRLDLAILGERNIWLRNENADLELGADLRVNRTDGNVFVSGILNTKRGYLYPPRLDVPFKLTKGEFEFTKSIQLDPNLDLEAETEVTHRIIREDAPDSLEPVLVKLEVTGTMREPKFNFYSEPSYPLEDIAALLTTGATRQEMASLGAMGRGGERVAGYYFRMNVLRQLQEQMPIDAIDVKTKIIGEEEERKAELTVGKYVSKDLYVSYTQDLFSRSKNQFKAEYYVWRGAAVVGERDEEDRYNLGLQFKFKY